DSSKYSVGNWPSQASSTFSYPSSHSQPPNAHTNFSSTTNSSAYHSQHNWGHVLKDSSLLWSTMKSSDSQGKNFPSKKKT
ncbi:unnamed protein product, partial [Rotaria magnacalcarata]